MEIEPGLPPAVRVVEYAVQKPAQGAQMGIGGAIFLISFGAILAYAFHVDLKWIDLRAMGWIFILAGVAVLVMTLWFWRDRRKRQRAMSVVEETRLIHDPGPVTPEPPDTTPPP